MFFFKFSWKNRGPQGPTGTRKGPKAARKGPTGGGSKAISGETESACGKKRWNLKRQARIRRQEH